MLSSGSEPATLRVWQLGQRLPSDPRTEPDDCHTDEAADRSDLTRAADGAALPVCFDLAQQSLLPISCRPQRKEIRGIHRVGTPLWRRAHCRRHTATAGYLPRVRRLPHCNRACTFNTALESEDEKTRIEQVDPGCRIQRGRRIS